MRYVFVAISVIVAYDIFSLINRHCLIFATTLIFSSDDGNLIKSQGNV